MKFIKNIIKFILEKNIYKILFVFECAIYVVISFCFFMYGFDNTCSNNWYKISILSVIPLLKALSDFFIKKKDDFNIKQYEKLNNIISTFEPLKNNFEEIFDIWLLYILKNILKTNESDCRISFYVFDDRGGNDDKFKYVARESLSPQLKRKGRNEFRADLGVISETWQQSFAKYFFIKNISKEDYKRESIRRWGFTEEEFENLTFYPKTILGAVIKDANGRQVGIVIFEKEKYTSTNQRDYLCKQFREGISNVSSYIYDLFNFYSNIILNQEE